MICTAQAEQVLKRPSEFEPGSLDPQKMSSANSVAIARDLFVGLLTLDADNKPIPGAAESWRISPDGKEWVFHLRNDLKWSNGEPLTSADFLYSFRRLVDPATAADDPSDLAQLVNYEAILSGKEKDLTKLGVDAPDPNTLRLRLISPRLALRFLLTDSSLFPLPHAIIEKWGKDWTKPEHLVSNGPFTLKSWVPQAEIVIARNPNFYAADTVRFDEVHWIDASDAQASLRRFRAGEIDWVDCLSSTITSCRRNSADVMHLIPINAVRFIIINMTKGPLAKDVRLREALSLAIDRETLVDKVKKMDQTPAYSLTPPVVSDYTAPTISFKPLSMTDRIARAKSLMRAAGYDEHNHLRVVMSYGTDEAIKPTLLAVAGMWKQIFVDTDLDDMEPQIYENRLDTRDYEIGILGNAGSYDDYETMLDNFRGDSGAANFTGYNSAAFDELFHRGGQSLDLAERRNLMQQAEAVALADEPVIPLFFEMYHRLVNPKLGPNAYRVPYPQSRFLSFQ